MCEVCDEQTRLEKMTKPLTTSLGLAEKKRRNERHCDSLFQEKMGGEGRFTMEGPRPWMLGGKREIDLGGTPKETG